jgi:hypothetical protein
MGAASVETSLQASSQQQLKRLKTAATAAGTWLADQLEHSAQSRLTGTQYLLICTIIFFSAIGVRILHWQDSHVEIAAGKISLGGVLNRYEKEARRMLEERAVLFPTQPPSNGDARMLVHPPGYSILLAAIYLVDDDPRPVLWLVQILCDGVATLLVFAIALELMNWRVALVAALLAAFSPHLAHYSLILSPDTLAVVPILIAIYFLVRMVKRPRLLTIVAVGAFIGLSCWLRANALLLAPFLSVVALPLFPRGKRLLYSIALMAGAIFVISPITIRNLIVFHCFIPISIASGENLVVGIGDYDKEGTFGMPRSDRETRLKDVEWSNRPDYAASLWSPDGVYRDRARFARGVVVIRAHPAWFLGIMLRRASFMLRYNDSHAHEWPENTAVVPIVYARTPFGHAVVSTEAEPRWLQSPAVLIMNGSTISKSLAVTEDKEPVWSASARELVELGTALSPGSAVTLAQDSLTLQVAGDGFEYAEQFQSVPIPVRSDTDYVLVVPVDTVRGNMALKITSADRRTSAAVAAIAGADAEANGERSDRVDDVGAPTERMTVMQVPFASGQNTSVRLVITNNGGPEASPVIRAGTAQIFEMGSTPYTWTSYPRRIVRGFEKSLFSTGRMLPAIIIGVALLAFAGRGRTLAMVLAVPVYYLLAQSALSTEYRYILAIHYFLFVMAGVTIGCFAIAVGQASRWLVGMTWKH